MYLMTDRIPRPNEQLGPPPAEPWMDIRTVRVLAAYRKHLACMEDRCTEVSDASIRTDGHQLHPSAHVGGQRLTRHQVLMRRYARVCKRLQALLSALDGEAGTIRLPLREVGFIVRVEEGLAMDEWLQPDAEKRA